MAGVGVGMVGWVGGGWTSVAGVLVVGLGDTSSAVDECMGRGGVSGRSLARREE